MDTMFLDKTLLGLRQSRLVNSFNQKLRNLRSTKKIQSKNKSTKKGFPKFIIKLNPRKYLLMIISALVTIFIIFNLSIYISINPKPLLKDDASASLHPLDSKEINVVFLGFENRLN